MPAKFTPNIADGAVESMVQVGNRMVVGGSFTTVTPTAGAGAGTAVTRNYLFAFNATTGALDTGFVPAVNGEVDAIVPTADGTGVYVGGKFTTAGGVSTRLAEFNLTTGARVTTFNPSLNGPINDMALVGNRLFVAGTFTSVKSVAHDGLVSVNATHRRARPVPDRQPDRPPQLRPGRGRHQRSRRRDRHRGLAGRHPHDRRRQLHQRRRPGESPPATRVTRSPTSSSARLGDGRPELEHQRLHPRLLLQRLRLLRAHIGWSPDGSYFVVAATGGYNGGSFQDCDSASRFDASSTGLNVTAGVDRLHRHRLALLGRGHVRCRLRRRPQPLAEQPVRAGQLARTAPSRDPGWPRSTRRTASRCRGTPAVTPAVTAPRSSTPPPPASGSAATPTTSATTSTSTRSWRSSRSPAVPRPPATTPVTRAPSSSPARRQLLYCQQLRPDDRRRFGGLDPAEQRRRHRLGHRPQGAFVLNGRIWYGSGGQFYYRTWDGANAFGPAQLVDPYNDPYWDNVVDGSSPSGSTYRGAVPSFYAELPKVTGMFYANRSIYYTPLGKQEPLQPGVLARHRDLVGRQPGDRRRDQRPWRGTVVSGGNPVDFSNAGGMFVANGYLWYATKSDGKLHKAPWNGTTVTGGASVDTLGHRELGRPGGVRLAGRTARSRRPRPSPSSCPDATCYFDASASTAPGSTITSYSWDFGDGNTGSGVKPTHTYARPGPTRSS